MPRSFTLSICLSIVLSASAALAQPTYQYNDRVPNHYYNNDDSPGSSNGNTPPSPLAAIPNAVLNAKPKEASKSDADTPPLARGGDQRPSYVRTKQIDAYPPGVKTGGAKPSYSDLYSAKQRAVEARE